MEIKLTRARYQNNDDGRRRLGIYIKILRSKPNLRTIKMIKDQFEAANTIPPEMASLYRDVKALYDKLAPPPITVQPSLSLPAPITHETETSGEKDFQDLYAYLVLDIANQAINPEWLIFYERLVFNLFMHAATYTPRPGHGKAQEREYKNKTQLQYARSQGRHPNNEVYKSSIEGRVKGKLPLNAGFIRLLQPPEFPAKLCSILKKIVPATGLAKINPKTKEPYTLGSFDGDKVAHAGARRHNLAILGKTLENYKNNPGIREKVNSKIRRPKKQHDKIPSAELQRRIVELKHRFSLLSNTQTQPKTAGLQGWLLHSRIDRTKCLIANTQNLKKITLLTSQQDITCLMIRLYPTYTQVNDTYTQGVTNVLLSFFAALLNQHLQAAGYDIYAQRRQSFGFLRPTLTDAGYLTIRLSLGLEPSKFDDIILKSLNDFDVLLEKYDFGAGAAAESQIVREVIKVPVKTTEQQRHGDAPIRSVVRSDDMTLTTYNQALAYLNKAKETEDTDYQEKGLDNFLRQYVLNGASLPDVSLNNPPTTDMAPHNATLTQMFGNIIQYTHQFVEKLDYLKENEPLGSFAHVYWHSLLKLYNNLHEAQYLLAHRDTQTASAFFKKATLLSENILEYLISLDGLKQCRAKIQGQPLDPIKTLKDTEAAYAARQFSIDQKKIDCYLMDSGQQANVTTLLVFLNLLHGQEERKNYGRELYICENSYYELPLFLKDIRKDGEEYVTNNKAAAKIAFTDISCLHNFNVQDYPAMQGLIIDITHHPHTHHALLKKIVSEARAQGVFIALTESCLKHQQLGLDKYQSGKVMVISPNNDNFKDYTHTEELLADVSKEAEDPCIASYLQMVNEICGDKILPPVKADNATPATVMARTGLFSTATRNTGVQPDNKQVKLPVLVNP